ncbi:MAG: glutathione S-transferase family protein [Gloeotrichia echinulata HAB0833]
MKLYYAPASSYSQRVLIALYVKNIAFIPVEVDLFEPDTQECYKRINPFSKIPTLETDDGQVLFEACVIIEYLDQYFQNKPRLIPLDPERALEVRMLERIIDVYVNGGREALFADTQRPVEDRGSKQVVKAQRLLKTACTFLDERLNSRTWLAGEEFSLADCAAAPTLTYLRMVYNYQHLSRLTDYVNRLESSPFVAKVQREGHDQMMRMLTTLKYPLNFMLLNTR